MKHLALSLAGVFLGLTLVLSAQATASENETAFFDQTHSAWNKVVQSFVTTDGAASRVNYSALKAHPNDLNTYLAGIERVSSEDFSGFTEKQRLAFLINAYNALTVKLILDHYPVKSIRDIGGLFSNAWKIKFFTLFGEKHRLDDIEHEMIRKKFNEPRIHFALVCASKGCPALRNEAFVAVRLDEQLDRTANAFLRDSKRNRFDAKATTLNLSSIFKWYGEDFEKKFGSVKAFVAPRIAKDSAEEATIKNDKVKSSYLDYDWSLNE